MEKIIYFDHKYQKFNFAINYNNEMNWKNHLDKHNHISLYNSRYNNGTIKVQKDNLLYFNEINLKKMQEHLYLDLFNSNIQYWKDHFTNFNKENYPEYFI